MKPFLINLIFFCSSNQSISQQKIAFHIKDYFRQSALLGSSISYTWNSDSYFAQHFYQEYSWNINAGMRLSKRFWFGGHFNPIFTWQLKNGLRKQRNYFFGGTFLKYDLIQSDLFILFLEGSINKTNYCTCGDFSDPYREPDLWTWGTGAGLKFLLNPEQGKNV